MVPLVFFSIRFWGSIRAILYFLAADQHGHYNGSGGWLKYMQAIFDPSQGFFNALLFVVTSTEGRQNVVIAWAYLSRYWRMTINCLCPWFSNEKKRSDSNMDSAEMTSNITGEGYFNSLKGDQNGLREVLNTSAFDSSAMGHESSTNRQTSSDRYGVSEVRIESSFSEDEHGNRLSFSRPQDLDILTVPENITINNLVRNSINPGPSGV